MKLNGNVHCVITKSGSEPTQQTKQLNLLRYNRTLGSLQLDKQNATTLTTQINKTLNKDCFKQRTMTQKHETRPLDKQLDKQNNNSIIKTTTR